jgi:hypothetical protein
VTLNEGKPIIVQNLTVGLDFLVGCLFLGISGVYAWGSVNKDSSEMQGKTVGSH